MNEFNKICFTQLAIKASNLSEGARKSGFSAEVHAGITFLSSYHSHTYKTQNFKQIKLTFNSFSRDKFAELSLGQVFLISMEFSIILILLKFPNLFKICFNSARGSLCPAGPRWIIRRGNVPTGKVKTIHVDDGNPWSKTVVHMFDGNLWSKTLFEFKRDFVYFPVSRDFPYSRDFVLFPVSRDF